MLLKSDDSSGTILNCFIGLHCIYSFFERPIASTFDIVGTKAGFVVSLFERVVSK